MLKPPFLEEERIIDMNSRFNLKTITRIAILSAVAMAVMLMDFPVPVAPSFYKLDFSEVPALIGGFALGPLEAVIIELLKNLLKLMVKGTSTGFVGELANFVTGCAFVLPAALIYNKDKTKENAIKGLIAGSLIFIVFGDLFNYFVLIPAYVAILHYPLEAIVAAGRAIFPALVTNQLTMVLVCVTLFNTLKAILVSIVTLLLYKRVSPLLH
jgi:riboflavin transporter FmnP